VLALRLALVVAAAASVASCTQSPPPKARADAAPTPPKVEHTLVLPGSDGRVHIVAIRDRALFEVTRCLVAVGPNGQAAVSCAPKDIDLSPDDE
jgi:hypothetical protein